MTCQNDLICRDLVLSCFADQMVHRQPHIIGLSRMDITCQDIGQSVVDIGNGKALFFQGSQDGGKIRLIACRPSPP